jgi:hypothetical protein
LWPLKWSFISVSEGVTLGRSIDSHDKAVLRWVRLSSPTDTCQVPSRRRQDTLKCFDSGDQSMQCIRLPLAPDPARRTKAIGLPIRGGDCMPRVGTIDCAARDVAFLAPALHTAVMQSATFFTGEEGLMRHPGISQQNLYKMGIN